MGELRIAREVNSVLVTYALGSCVGVSVYDPTNRVGGLLHAMLPSSEVSSASDTKRLQKYVNTGLVALFREVIAMGGARDRLEVKMAGGGEFLNSNQIYKIGERNIAAVHSFLSRNNLLMAAEHTGGRSSRAMWLDLETGTVTLNIPNADPLKI